MEDTGKQKFEEGWREAFAEAEVSPSQNVWPGIANQLGNDSMKRRVLFYQRLAAASILFAFLAGAFGFYWRDKHNDQAVQLAKGPSQNQEQKIQQGVGSSITKSAASEEKVSDTHQTAKTTTTNETKFNKTVRQENFAQTSSHTDDQNRFMTTIKETNEQTVDHFDSKKSAPNQIAFYQSRFSEIENAPLFSVDVKGEPVHAEIVRKLPALPSVFMDRDDKKYQEIWWASAGASAGAYNPNYNSPASSSAYQNMLPVAKATSSSMPASTYGTSYSVALAAAHRISKRWIVQSGMQYMARSSNYTSNITSYSGNKMSASLADYASTSTMTSSFSMPYEVESRSEYISIPLQAGYLLVDRKFSWLLNSGFSSDIFLKNTLTDLSGQRDSYSESAGQNSPYRTFMWSALMSTELSYKMGKHYRIALVPGMRYSLNPVLKSDQGSQGNPMIWDVGFRFRYIFK